VVKRKMDELASPAATTRPQLATNKKVQNVVAKEKSRQQRRS
jgi:hypothetical protein